MLLRSTQKADNFAAELSSWQAIPLDASSPNSPPQWLSSGLWRRPLNLATLVTFQMEKGLSYCQVAPPILWRGECAVTEVNLGTLHTICVVLYVPHTKHVAAREDHHSFWTGISKYGPLLHRPHAIPRFDTCLAKAPFSSINVCQRMVARALRLLQFERLPQRTWYDDTSSVECMQSIWQRRVSP